MGRARILQEFPYRPNPRQGLFMVVLASGGFPLGWILFFHPDLGGELPVAVGTFVKYFFGAVLVLSPMVALALLTSIVHPMIYPRRVAFTADSVILPKPSRLGLSTQEIEVRFDSIEKVELRVLIDWILIVHHCEGVFTLTSVMFPTKALSQQVLNRFTDALAAVRTDLGGQLLKLQRRAQSPTGPAN